MIVLSIIAIILIIGIIIIELMEHHPELFAPAPSEGGGDGEPKNEQIK